MAKMPATVLAAVKTGVETTALQEFPFPIPAPDRALLRVESSGVGGSDPETYRKPNHAPIIMGHENVGTIAQIGEVAAARWGLKSGDRVALHEYLPCWHCKWCLQGDYRLCEEVDFFLIKDRLNTPRFGMCACTIAPYLWGGFAQYMHLPANAVLHKIPAEMDARQATLAIPLGNGFQWAVLDGGAGPGKSVLVFGPGQQGLGCALAAKACGAVLVILVGQTRDSARLALGRDLGADVVVDTEQEDLKAVVMRLTGGKGVDVVVDTTGDPSGEIARIAITLAAKGACLNLNGLEQQVPIGEIKRWYLTVRAPRGHSRRSVDLALQLIGSGRWPLDKICSHDFGLDEVDLAIKATAGREVAGAIHVTVDPWRTQAGRLQ
jgi:threonine dehydrogenase-like Zn-dependent dehydrogenase